MAWGKACLIQLLFFVPCAWSFVSPCRMRPLNQPAIYHSARMIPNGLSTRGIPKSAGPRSIGTQRSLFSGTYFGMPLLKRQLGLILATYFFISQIRSSYRRRRRQAMDDTSEWAVYAAKPGLRGRAILMLLLKVTALMIVARLADGRKKLSPNRYRTRAGEIVAQDMLRLGPLYIKIGQILSCRPNLFPDEWKVPMETLQDKVPAKQGQDAWELAYQAYDNNITLFHSIFKSFDPVPIAAASLGQVHRAVLHQHYLSSIPSNALSSAQVAIKIQRPKLREIYDKDLKLMQNIAKQVDEMNLRLKHFKTWLENKRWWRKQNYISSYRSSSSSDSIQQSWQDIFSDAETILYREIDYRKEAENCIQFAKNFGLGFGGVPIQPTVQGMDGKMLPSAADWVRTPFVFQHISNEKCLVMEYVPSIKISNETRLQQVGLTKMDREYLAESLARSYLRQFCVNKFFSTDPHPGNLGVEIRQGGKLAPRLVFYDFGQACYLKDDQAEGIFDVIEGIIDMNVDKCVAAFTKMGVLVEGADLDKVKRKVRDNFESGKIKVKKRRLKKRNVDQGIWEDTTDTKNSHSNSFSDSMNTGSTINYQESNRKNSTTTNLVLPLNETTAVQDSEIMSFFTLPAEYAFVARAISQMDGVGKGLDKDFDFISACAPYIVEIKGAELYIADLIKKNILDLEKKGLEWQSRLFKQLGFDPSYYKKSR